MKSELPAPFHQGPPEADPDRRRILLVSFHFPPAETAGAFRWQQLAHHADRRGWSMDVLTCDPGPLDAGARARLATLPNGIRVFGVPESTPWLERVEGRVLAVAKRVLRRTPETASDASAPPAPASPDPVGAPAPRAPASFGRHEIAFAPAQLESWKRAYTAWTFYQRERAWARQATRIGEAVVREAGGRTAFVMACGPPHWADHLAAARIARRAGLPFAMDLRDPWSLVERLPSSLASPVWLWRSRRDEQRSLRQAELVVMNTEGARDAMRALHPTASDRIEAVMNGVDGEPLPAPAPGEQDDDGAFVAAYAGTVYLDRDPSGLFRAAARVVEEQGLSPARFRIEFMGEAPEAEIARAAAAAGIPDHVVVHPRGTRDEASAFLERAALLLSLPQDSHLAVPSKIFEYMRFPAALLALAAPGSATAILLRDSEADVVDPGDVDGIAEVLARRFREFAAGKRPSPLAGDPRFGRRRQADHLFDRIERLASGPR